MRRYFYIAILILIVTLPLNAQTGERGRTPVVAYGITSPVVTATESQNQLRFTALALAQKIRLQVLSQMGKPVYDSGFQPGNRFEWSVKDQQGSGLGDGVYGCLVTLADLNGQLSHRWAAFRVKEGAVTFDTGNQEAARGAADEVGNVTILRAEEPSPFTFVSHDGREGWIESATGGLSFNAGSLSRSRDAVPHLRLTTEGNVGIGVAEPQAKLDVAGVIRASEGFQLSDGTVLKIEDGMPVLVSERSSGNGGSSSSTAGRSARVLAVGGGIGLLYTGGRSHGRVDFSETGSNTLFGEGAGGALTTGTNNSFFGQSAGSANTEGSNNSFFGGTAGKTDTTGADNSFFGEGAGQNNTTGSFNSFFGRSAGVLSTTGNSNSFFGRESGLANTTGSENVFVGRSAGFSNTTASDNAFVGFQAGYSNTSGGSNSFLGQNAGYANSTGSGNTFVGQNAGASNTTAGNNSFFGSSAGLFNTTGFFNSFFGNSAGYSNTTGAGNAFFGQNAGSSNTDAINNSFFGSYTGTANTTGDRNTFIGNQAGRSNTSGRVNSFVGAEAGYNNTTGDYNSFAGYQAGYSNTTGNENSFVGQGAGYGNTTGIGNSFFGRLAGQSNTTAAGNSFFGWRSGYLNTTGGINSFFGTAAGYANTKGSGNSFFGSYAGEWNTEGDNNAFFGNVAGGTNTTGYSNSFFGAYAGSANSTARENSFFGYSAGSGNTTGTSNSYVGVFAGSAGSTASENSFLGWGTGGFNTTGGDNTFIGYGAGSSNTNESNNTLVGASSDGAAGITNATAIGYRAKVTQSNSLILGGINGINGATADTNVGMGTTSPNYRLHIYHTGTYPRIYVQGDTGRYPGFQLGFDSAGSKVALVRAVEQETNGTALQFYTRTDASAMVQGMVINDVGNVGIGTANPTERLQVAGNLKVSGAILYGAPEMELPDFVFESNYDLMPIRELERFIAREKHLPNVPKASEIREKGLNLSEFQMKLLEKIEELTLYTVQQAKVIGQKDAEITALNARLAALEQAVERLKRLEERE
jgi:hypothetical protein